MAEFDPVELLRTLNDNGVRFVLIGGVAARLRGAPLLTQDVDVTPADTPPNLEALSAALRDLDAKLRTPDDPGGVAFPIDPAMLGANRNWTLTTRAGDLDLVFQPDGSQGYEDLIRAADTLAISEDGTVMVPVAALADIIRTKEAAGRAKDRAALPLLRQALEETGK